MATRKAKESAEPEVNPWVAKSKFAANKGRPAGPSKTTNEALETVKQNVTENGGGIFVSDKLTAAEIRGCTDEPGSVTKLPLGRTSVVGQLRKWAKANSVNYRPTENGLGITLWK